MTAGSIKFFEMKRSRAPLRETKTGASAPERSPAQMTRRSIPAPFRNRVLAVVRRISRGKTLTYKEVARRAGNPKAARAVGAILKTNFDPNIPCHRVIRSNGSLGGYNRGVQKKKKLLEEEQ